MAIKAIVDTLDAVPEALREHYKPHGDKFALDVDGAKTQADIDRVLEAKRQEVERHNATREKLTAFGELSPDDVKAKLERLTLLEAAGNGGTADQMRQVADALAAGKLAEQTRELNQNLATAVSERDAARTESSGLKAKLDEWKVDAAVRDAATKAHVVPDAVDHVVRMGRSLFKLDGDSIVDEQGREPAAWVDSLRATNSFLWPLARGAGGGSTPLTPPAGDNPWAPETFNLTRQGQITTQNPRRAQELRKAAGK